MTAFHVVFQVDYGDQDHALRDLQKWYRRKIDSVLLGSAAASPSAPGEASTSTSTSTSTSGEAGKETSVNVNEQRKRKRQQQQLINELQSQLDDKR